MPLIYTYIYVGGRSHMCAAWEMVVGGRGVQMFPIYRHKQFIMVKGRCMYYLLHYVHIRMLRGSVCVSTSLMCTYESLGDSVRTCFNYVYIQTLRGSLCTHHITYERTFLTRQRKYVSHIRTDLLKESILTDKHFSQCQMQRCSSKMAYSCETGPGGEAEARWTGDKERGDKRCIQDTVADKRGNKKSIVRGEGHGQRQRC